MSNTATPTRALPNPIKGPGLTNAGVILIQFLLILLIETFEYSISKVGIITGLAIIISVAGGIYLGREGTSFAANRSASAKSSCKSLMIRVYLHEGALEDSLIAQGQLGR